MKREVLPIGTVCQLDDNKKVMIIGYKNISFVNNEVLIKDYSGIKYPEGVSTDIRIIFDNEDIKSILYMGYTDESFENIKYLLTDNAYETPKMKSTYQFDENGVVVAEVKKPVKNPFSINDVPAKTVNVQPDEWPIFNNDNKVKESVEELLPGDVPDQKKSISGTKYIFDENGIVIGVEGQETPVEEPSKPKYQFDENGVVIGVAGQEETTEKPSKSKYQFDENGVVIGVEGQEETTEEPSKQKYQFDENGVVIGVE